MITIPLSSKIIKAKREFYHKLAPLILDRLDDQSPNNLNGLPILNIDRLKKFIEDYLYIILVGTPEQIITLSSRVNKILKGRPDWKSVILDVLDYTWFTTKTVNRYCGYNLASALQINVCVYCNRSYTDTIIKNNTDKIARPQFDHFFNKGRHPLIALSFYNLIPSCSICNSSVKHAADFNLTDHHHPYLDNFINDFFFSYGYCHKSLSGLKVVITSNSSKTASTLKDMETEVIYNSHSNELKHMIDMRYKFSDNYLAILDKHILDGVIISKNEMYSLAFGTEMEAKMFGNRPLSKFKSDILKQLKII